MTASAASFKHLGQAVSKEDAPLLLLHGWQHSIQNLLSLGQALSAEREVYLLDLPGFGNAPIQSEDWSTAEYVRYVHDFIQSQGIKPIVLGHSFGGRITVKLAALYPEAIADKIILIGVPGLPRSSLWKKTRRLYLRYLAKSIKLFDLIFRTKFFLNHFAPRFGSTDYKNAGRLKNLFVKTVNEDLTQFAAKIKKEAFLLWGKNDFEAPLEQAYGYKELIVDSTLQVLPHHGHEPFADVGSHYVARLIKEFIAKSR